MTGQHNNQQSKMLGGRIHQSVEDRHVEKPSSWQIPRQACLFSVLGSLILATTGCGQSTGESVSQKNSSAQPAQESVYFSEPAGKWDIDVAAHPASSPSEAVTVHNASQTRMIQNDLQASVENPLGLDQAVSPANSALPASGSAEWDVQQIAGILAEVARNSASAPSEDQNRRIVALATHAISLTHSRPEKELVFNAAIHSLMDARLNLALSGDQESLNAIYEDAATLSEKHPRSTAATTAAASVVKMSQEMAAREGRNSPWVSEYVRQAKLFAANFPEDEARAIVQLTSAAEFCEQHQLTLHAIECYTFAQQQFPESPFAPRTESALQRLHLVGKVPALEGPTLDGETIRSASLVGKPVLVAFWSSQSTEFAEDLALILELSQRSGCQLLGVNLDRQADQARQFVAAHNLPGKHIFHEDPALRGAAQPLVRQYGIHQLPSYWLIDKEGKVLSTCVTREQLKNMVMRTREASAESASE